ncbi:MAG: helix-turn-helix domain-containing protein [Flavobacteriales bacterium]|nr:helix-turn-helix domain-containing protein [Flavobacteriales bacterium]
MMPLFINFDYLLFFMEQNHEFSTAFQFASYTSQNLFLTGKAGTGKTTFLHHLKDKTQKNCIVIAPTGVAAINAGGVTIHSMFNLPQKSFAPTTFLVDNNYLINERELKKQLRFRKEKRKLLKSIQLIIIDEVSMVRSDILDAIDVILRFVRNSNLPFGGIQMVFIGDMFQLPPVVKETEWNYLKDFYKSPYFFDAKVLSQIPLVSIELKKIYRQKDQKFISLLNSVRNEEITDSEINSLNKNYIPNFSNFSDTITLTTHNRIATNINQKELAKLKAKSYSLKAEIHKNFKPGMFPTEEILHVKEGAQIMFIKNDSDVEKNYYNGKIAKITSITDDTEEGIQIEVEFNDSKEKYILKKEVWKNIKYITDEKTNKTKEEVIGTFTQYPIRLAWSVTIHKSQGLTFDKVVIDAENAFANGQVYVALSRCRTLEGITLNSKIRIENIKTDARIKEFHTTMWNNEQLESTLEKEKYNYAILNIINTFDFNSIQISIDNWRKEIEKNKNIDFLECKKLHSEIFYESTQWIQTSKKFANILKIYLQKFKNNELEWNEIEQRCIKATEYFKTTLEEKFLTPFLLHYKKYKSNSDAKAYNEEVSICIEELQIKRNNIKNLRLIDTQLYSISEKEIEEEKFTTKSEKVKKTPSYLKTYNLYQQNKSIHEIATELNLATTTITTHLIRCYENNLDINILDFIDNAKIEYLEPIYKTLETDKLKEFYEKCDEETTYNDLKFFIAYYQRNNVNSDS